MPDEIVLTLPVEEEFQRIAHLVLGGLAVRLDLTFEHLEDMQLALEGLLERRGETPMTVSVLVDDRTLRTAIGPFAGGAVADLEHDDDSPLGLRRTKTAPSGWPAPILARMMWRPRGVQKLPFFSPSPFLAVETA